MMSNRVLDEINARFVDANRQLMNVWLDEIVFTWRWWLNIALFIIPWIIWTRYKDRKSIVRLLFVGLIVAVITEILDTIGISYGVWHYDWTILPLFPIYIPWNFSLFPVLIMFMLQIKPKISPYIKAVLFGGFSGFIMEPLFERIGLYHAIRWNSLKSFIMYIPLYLFLNWVYEKVKQCESSP